MPAAVRKSKPACFSFGPEALEILRVLCPNTKGFGQFLSDLLCQEEARRHELRRLRHQLAAVVEDLG